MEVKTVDPARVAIAPHHRAIKPWSLELIKASIKDHGYNQAYPIVIEKDGTLVDGRHRLEAARALGLSELPFIYKPDGVSSIRFGLQCNADGQLAQPNDVFDYAELCYGLAQEGWTGEQIAEELGTGWGVGLVSYHKQIKEKLHSRAWDLARFTKNMGLVNNDETDLVNPNFTIVNWRETHFRALLRHLPYEGDHASMRAQVRAVKDIISRANEKDKRFGQVQKQVTAAWIDALASKYAWHLRLSRYLRDNLVSKVGMRDRVGLLTAVYNNVYGEKEDEKNFLKFDAAVKNLNEKALGVTLFHDDAFQRIPLLEDKSVSLVVTDPPYNVTDHEWDKIGTDDEYIEFTRKWLDAIRPKLADDFHLFFFCDPDYAARIERDVLIPDGWPLQSRGIWENRSLPSGRYSDMKLICNWQMIFHCGTHKLNYSPNWSDERFAVQNFSAPNENTRDGGFHPTPKPLGLITRLVSLGSKPTDTVLDPFAGGGTTGEACANIRQRRCILIEKDDQFCKNIESRLSIKREE